MKDINLWVGISNSYYNDESIENDELVIYTLIQRNRIISSAYEDVNYSIISIDMIRNYLNVKGDIKKWNKKIKEVIDRLLEKQLIIELYDLNYNKIDCYVSDFENSYLFYVCTDRVETEYFQIYYSELDRLFECLNDSNLDKFNIVRYYLALKRVTSNQQRFGFLAQSNIKICGENRTIKKYNDFLIENEFVIINNDYVTPKNKYHTTFVGQFGDEENFNYQLQSEVSIKNLIKVDKAKRNKKVSDTQKNNLK